MSARDRILAAARTRFAADGVYGATLDQVREDAQVSVGAIYHHFPDKERLAEAVWLDALERYQAGFLDRLSGSAAREGIVGAVEDHLAWVAAHRADAALLFSARPTAARERNRAFFRAVRDWGRDHAGELRALDLDLAHALWLGPAQEYCRHWLAGRARRVPAAVRDELAAAAWRALKGDR